MVFKENRFIRMTAEEYRNRCSGNKYHAQKTEINGVVYDSKKEANRSQELLYLERAGLVKNVRRQVRFELQPEYITKDGRKIKSINYVADYVYERPDGKMVVEDVKSEMTRKLPVYRIKKKMLEARYKDILFVET